MQIKSIAYSSLLLILIISPAVAAKKTREPQTVCPKSVHCWSLTGSSQNGYARYDLPGVNITQDSIRNYTSQLRIYRKGRVKLLLNFVPLTSVVPLKHPGSVENKGETSPLRVLVDRQKGHYQVERAIDINSNTPLNAVFIHNSKNAILVFDIKNKYKIFSFTNMKLITDDLSKNHPEYQSNK